MLTLERGRSFRNNAQHSAEWGQSILQSNGRLNNIFSNWDYATPSFAARQLNWRATSGCTIKKRDRVMCRSCWCTASARRRFRERAGMRFKIIAMVIALSAALVSARVAAAHTPIFIEREITSPDTAWPVDDYAISWALPSSTHRVQIERGVSFLSGASDGSTTAGHPIHVRSLGHAGAH